MALVPGTRLGPYEITAAIGAGGMGEVYQARDTRLDRTVAIKVLPATRASDPEFRERLQGEARAISQLDHPHICALYDVGEHEGTAFLVMQYLEGETLEQRLSIGKLPLKEALTFAIQIASALEAAHRAGIVHRDLKPGNIMLTNSGARLLDFGLAKWSNMIVAAGGSASLLTAETNLTGAGTILGTLHYMSPEVLEGKDAGARSDIFALGAVVFEMVTGTKAFPGSSAASVIGAILERQPASLSSLQPHTPRILDRLVTTCLAKRPDDRWQHAGDLRRELTWIVEANASLDEAVTASRSSTRERLVWLTASLIAVAITAAISTWWFTPMPEEPLLVARLFADVTPAESLGATRGNRIAWSPDGTRLVFVGRDGSVDQLYIRSVDRLEATPLVGTQVQVGRMRIDTPFWSADGQWIGFWSGPSGNAAVGELKKVPLGGGPPVPLCSTTALFGASWGDDNTIVFANAAQSGLSKVSANGGIPVALTTVDSASGDTSHRLPHVLPGSRVVLYTVQKGTYNWTDARVVVRSLLTDEQHVIAEGAADARYAPSGHVIYVRQGTLIGVPFDVNTLAVTGGPTGIVDGVRQDAGEGTFNETGAADFAVSSTGTLAYVAGSFRSPITGLEWIDRAGHRQSIPVPEREFSGPRLSPSGNQLTFFAMLQNPGVWTYDLRVGRATPFETSIPNARWPLWTLDGTRVVFGAGLVSNLWWKRVDDGGSAERLTNSEQTDLPSSWSPDGVLAFLRSVTPANRDIWTLSWDGGQPVARPFVVSEFNEEYVEFSPDGDWVAYLSHEQLRPEVFVRAYPGPSRAVQVSTNGGGALAWNRNGRELFYTVRGPEGAEMMVVAVKTAPTFTAEKPQKLFTIPPDMANMIAHRGWDVSEDGTRFLMTRRAPTPMMPTRIVLVQNWFEELKRLVPAN